MDLSNYKLGEVKKSTARTSREALIEQIAEATTETDKKKLCRALAIAANTLKWSDSQLHTLYQKRLDPKVKNYTALVWWHTKIGAKKVPQRTTETS